MRAEIVADSGSSASALVYVPGIDGTGEFLFKTAEALARDFRLVRLAYVGEPGEEGSSAGYGHLAASIAAHLRRLELERPILLAESFGVAVALRTALDHPQDVGALALVNGFARYDRRLSIRMGAALAPLLPAFAFDLARRFLVPRSLFGARLTPEALRSFFAVPTGRYDAAYRCRLRMIAHLDLLPELDRVRQPVQLFASEQDRVVPARRAAEAMAARLPDAGLELIPRAGHLILPFEAVRWRSRMEDLRGRVERRPTAGR